MAFVVEAFHGRFLDVRFIRSTCPLVQGWLKLAFGGLHLGDIHVEEADGIALEALLPGLVALDV
jgi:hypothetical protein